jgi:GDP-L-fucose synthase
VGRILVTGGSGFLGSHLLPYLQGEVYAPRSWECDLRDWAMCEVAVAGCEIVIHLAANVGGIGYNQAHPGKLFYENAIMGIQLMEAARRAGVRKFVAVGTVCAYPKFTPVPFKESDLWIGYPEETNAPYGLAKKMLLVQAQAYRQEYGFNAIYLLPVNLYGPRDNFDPNSSHVIPALIRKMIEARDRDQPSVTLWGTGAASREFLYVRDAAQAIALAAAKYDHPEPVNLGSGHEIPIRDLALLIREEVGYRGELQFDATKPDGQPRRCLDTERAWREFGFRAETDFRRGIRATIAWYEGHRFQIEQEERQRSLRFPSAAPGNGIAYSPVNPAQAVGAGLTRSASSPLSMSDRGE